MELSLKGKRALVCGSSQGIGLACAQELAKLGASCTLLARNEERLKQAVSTIEGSGHHFRIADFDHLDQVTNAVNQLLKEESVSILVNNSGGPPGGLIQEAEPSAFLQAYKRHLIVNQILVQAVLPGMKQDGYGRIINIISTSVKAPIANLGVSNTTRWAVAGWAKTLATEVAKYYITVNNVLPGSTLTGRLKSIFQQSAEQRDTTPDVIEKEWLSKIPMERFGKAEEIAALVAFLSSPAAAFITGTAIPVDGGSTPSL